MSVDLRIVARPEVAAGFGLSGLPTIAASTAEESLARLRALAELSTVGVVLMEDTFHRRMPDDLRRRLARHPLPMVVPFPGVTWAAAPEAAESYIVELLRQVIGYRVRLR